MFSTTAAIAKAIQNLIEVPSAAARINAWSHSTYGDDALQLDYFEGTPILKNATINPLYRIVYPPGSFVFSRRNFPGVSVLWVERWEEYRTDNGQAELKKVASRRFGICASDRFDRDERL